MELRNPLIELLAVRDAIGRDPASEFAKQMEKDTESYLSLQEKWNSGASGLTSRPGYDQFPPFEDYIAYRETGLQAWKNRYCALMSTARPMQLRLHSQAQQVVRPMDFYDRWVLSLYGCVLLFHHRCWTDFFCNTEIKCSKNSGVWRSLIRPSFQLV
ncbi:hypothetical protein B0H12DRAFT_172564 [Mycena haematopus]|nr:hypothetical protein B0H12DRAFT_172564 [Mycena haematopus]